MKGAAPRRGAAATDGPGPDLGPDPGPGAGFCQSTVYGDGGWFSFHDSSNNSSNNSSSSTRDLFLINLMFNRLHI